METEYRKTNLEIIADRVMIGCLVSKFLLITYTISTGGLI